MAPCLFGVRLSFRGCVCCPAQGEDGGSDPLSRWEDSGGWELQSGWPCPQSPGLGDSPPPHPRLCKGWWGVWSAVPGGGASDVCVCALVCGLCVSVRRGRSVCLLERLALESAHGLRSQVAAGLCHKRGSHRVE